MPSWNDTFTEADDWSHIDFVNMFTNAVIERSNAIHTTRYLFAAAVPVFSVGDDVQRYDWIQTMQAFVNDWGPEFWEGTEIEGTLTGIVNQSDYGPAAIADMPHYTLASLRAAAGINSAGFTRKFPREILTLASTADLQSQTIADGMICLCRADGQPYERVSGAFVPASSPADIKTAYGNLVIGDYIGPWIWNELRDVLNLLEQIWVVYEWGGTISTPAYTASVSKQSTSMAAAIALAEASYPGAVSFTSHSPASFAPYMLAGKDINAVSPPSNYRAALQSNSQYGFYVGDDPGSFSAKFYVFAHDAGPVSPPNPNYTVQFDDCGFTVNNRVWTAWNTTPTTSPVSTLQSDAPLGTITPHATWGPNPPDPVPGVSGTSNGFYVSRWIARLDFSVAYTYHA